MCTITDKTTNTVVQNTIADGGIILNILIRFVMKLCLSIGILLQYVLLFFENRKEHINSSYSHHINTMNTAAGFLIIVNILTQSNHAAIMITIIS